MIKGKQSRIASVDLDGASHEEMISVLSAAADAYRICLRLFKHGQWQIALGFLILAARCGHPEAESDLTLCRATGRQPGSTDWGEPAMTTSAARAWTRYWDHTTAARGRGRGYRFAMVALVVSGMAAASALGYRTGSMPGTGETRPGAARATLSPDHAVPPEVKVSFAPIPSASAPSLTPAVPASAGHPELEVTLAGPPGRRYVVTLKAPASKACEWRIVRSLQEALADTGTVNLQPGEEVRAAVTVGESSGLSVFSGPDGPDDGCQVLSGGYAGWATPTEQPDSPASDPVDPIGTPPPTPAGTSPAPKPPHPNTTTPAPLPASESPSAP
ncbi:hypothetical protein J2S41_002242 [Catenuloplanes atrovinosus]|uniref:Uncharacterized protein n=1 Tax=Catenuloplanes atrovinosus TaxID=137266 RepID=A0AAE3YKH8_9ACTN|nr:hypothetical protein [Catenuloplanes atrovinosus]